MDASTGQTAGSFGTGSTPYGVAYDPANNSILVVNAGDRNVTVYNITQGKVTAQIPVGALPESIGVDTKDGLVIVADTTGGNVTVFNASTFRNHQSFGVGGYPRWVNVSSSGHIYVTNQNSANVTVIDGSNLAAPTTQIPVGNQPEGAAYDPAGAEYVISYGSNNMTEILDPTIVVVATIPTVTDPTAVAYDASHDVYYVGTTYGQLLLVNAQTLGVTNVLSLPILPDYFLAIPSLGELWMSGIDSMSNGWVDVLNEATLTVTLQHGMGGVGPLAYDPTDGTVCLANSAGNISLIDPATDVGTGSIALPLIGGVYAVQPAGLVWDFTNDNLYATSGSLNDSVTVVNVATDSVTNQIPTGHNPTGIGLDPLNGEIYVTNQGSNNLTVISPLEEAGTFGSGTGTGPDAILYDDANGLLYVANGGSDNISVLDPGTSALVATLPVGADPVALAYASLIGNVSVANEAQGTLSVIGNPGPAPPVFTVTFATSPTTCTIIFDGTVYSNGETYPNVAGGSHAIAAGTCGGEAFGSWVTSTGTLTSATSPSTELVVTGTGTLTAVWLPTEYRINVVAIPASCQILFDGTTYGNGETIVNVTYGSHYLQARVCFGENFESWAATQGVLATPGLALSYFDVTADSTLTVTYTARPTYPVTFAETGLPSGTDWSVLVGGTTVSSTTGQVVFEEPNAALIVGIPEEVVGSAQYLPTVPSTSPTFEAYLGGCPDTYCGALLVAGVPVTVQIVYGQTWAANWVPARDTYQFPNPGSIFSPFGNCYGISVTEVLYWLNEINANTEFPYLPLQPGGAANTAALSESQGWLSWSNGGYPPYTLNNATLAITIHQVLDPANYAVVQTLQDPEFLQSSQFSILQSSVAVQGGVPMVIGMGSPNPSGGNTYYHAVIVYGMTQFPNGTWELDISDPNVPSVGTNGWYSPASSSFFYDDGYAWRQFAPVNAQFLDSSFISGYSDHGEALNIPHAYNFVLSNVPVTLRTPTTYFQGKPFSQTDSFGDNGYGNSQTFDGGISQSVGIEEGSMQAYGVPTADAFTIDPPAARSSLLTVWSVNSSGVYSDYGFAVGTRAPGPGDYNLTPNSNGFNFTADASLTLQNVSFFYGSGSEYTVFHAYNLTLGAGVTARFTVDSWPGLNSSTVPSVTLREYASESAIPYGTYGLTNHENGLPSGSSAASPGVPVDLILFGGIAGGAVAVGVVIFYRRRKGARIAP